MGAGSYRPWRLDPSQKARSTEHVRLTFYMVRRLNKLDELGKLERDDAEQEAAIGLMRAAFSFDDGRGVPFASYACVAIGRRVRRAALFATHPTLRAYPHDDETLSSWVDDRVEEPALAAHRAEIVDSVRHALSALPPRWQIALRMTFTDGLSASEVGRAMGVSKQRVLEILGEAKRRLAVNLRCLASASS